MIKIHSKTDLPYRIIGQVIDHYVNTGDDGETHYAGKIDHVRFEYKNKGYSAQLKYGTRDVDWYFFEEDTIVYDR